MRFLLFQTKSTQLKHKMDWIKYVPYDTKIALKTKLMEYTYNIFDIEESTEYIKNISAPYVDYFKILNILQSRNATDNKSTELRYNVGSWDNIQNKTPANRTTTISLRQAELLYFSMLLTYRKWMNVDKENHLSFMLFKENLLFSRLYFDVDPLIQDGVISKDLLYDYLKKMCKCIEIIVGKKLKLYITSSDSMYSKHIISDDNFDIITKVNIEEMVCDHVNLLFNQTFRIEPDLTIYNIGVNKHHVTDVYLNDDIEEVYFGQYTYEYHFCQFPVNFFSDKFAIYTKMSEKLLYMETCDTVAHLNKNGELVPLVYDKENKIVQLSSYLSVNNKIQINSAELDSSHILDIQYKCDIFNNGKNLDEPEDEELVVNNNATPEEPYEIVFNSKIKLKKDIHEILGIDVGNIFNLMQNDDNDIESINQIIFPDIRETADYSKLFTEDWDVDIDENIIEQCVKRGESLDTQLYEKIFTSINTTINERIPYNLLIECLKYYSDDFSEYNHSISKYIITEMIKTGNFTMALSLVLEHATFPKHKMYNTISVVVRLMNEFGIKKRNALYTYSVMIKMNEYEDIILLNIQTSFRAHIIYFLLKFTCNDSETHKKNVFSEIYQKVSAPAINPRKRQRVNSEITREFRENNGSLLPAEDFQKYFVLHVLCVKKRDCLELKFESGSYIEISDSKDRKPSTLIGSEISLLDYWISLPVENRNCKYWIYTPYGIFNPVFGIEPNSPSFLSCLHIHSGTNFQNFDMFNWQMKNTVIDAWIKSYHFLKYLNYNKTSIVLLAPVGNQKKIKYPEELKSFNIIDTDFNNLELSEDVKKNFKHSHEELLNFFDWVYIIICELSKTNRIDDKHPRTTLYLFNSNLKFSYNAQKSMRQEERETQTNSFIALLDRNIPKLESSDTKGLNNPLNVTKFVKLTTNTSLNVDIKLFERAKIPDFKLDYDMIDDDLFFLIFAVCSWLIRYDIPSYYKNTKFFKNINKNRNLYYELMKDLIIKYNGPLYLKHGNRYHLGIYLKEFCENSEIIANSNFNIPMPLKYKLNYVGMKSDIEIYTGMATLMFNAQFDQSTFVELTKDLVQIIFATNFNRNAILFYGQEATGKDGFVTLLEHIVKGKISSDISGKIDKCENENGCIVTHNFYKNLMLYANEVPKLTIAFNRLSDQSVLSLRNLYNNGSIDYVNNAHLILMSNTPPECPNRAVISRIRPYNRLFCLREYKEKYEYYRQSTEDTITYITDFLGLQLILKSIPATGNKIAGVNGIALLMWFCNDFFFRNLQKPISRRLSPTMEKHLLELKGQVSPSQHLLNNKIIIETGNNLIPYSIFVSKVKSILQKDLNITQSRAISAVFLDLTPLIEKHMINDQISLDVVV